MTSELFFWGGIFWAGAAFGSIAATVALALCQVAKQSDLEDVNHDR